MEDTESIGRSLPIYAELPALALAVLLLWLLVKRTSSPASRFVLVAVWLRCILGALHEFSFAKSPVGLSYNALASILVFAVGLVVVRRRSLIGAALIPFWIYGLALVLSAATSGALPDMITTLTKILYLVILILAIEDAIEDDGADRFLTLLVGAFALPFGLQLISLALGIAKPGEDNNAASYIGGFYHEAAFSLVLAGALMTVCLIRSIGLGTKIALIGIGLIGILAANYRTAIVAMLPLIGVSVVISMARRVVPQQRALVAAFIALGVAGLGVAGGVAEKDRFADLAVVATQGTSLIKPPEQFTEADRQVMSGRIAIWSGYLYKWADGSPTQRMFGYGPGSSWHYFVVYAHNSLVGALFELGIAGVIATIFLWIWFFVLACLAKRGPRAELIVGHGCFFLFNMATMPTYMIEGMILYAVLCGATLHYYHLGRRSAIPAFSRRRRRHVLPT